MKRLWTVRVEAELLVWAEAELDAETVARHALRYESAEHECFADAVDMENDELRGRLDERPWGDAKSGYEDLTVTDILARWREQGAGRVHQADPRQLALPGLPVGSCGLPGCARTDDHEHPRVAEEEG